MVLYNCSFGSQDENYAFKKEPILPAAAVLLEFALCPDYVKNVYSITTLTLEYEFSQIRYVPYFSWKQLRKRNMCPNTSTSVSFEHTFAKYFLESLNANKVLAVLK